MSRFSRAAVGYALLASAAIAVAPAALADDFVDTEGRMLCSWIDDAKLLGTVDPSSPYAPTPQQVMNNMMTYVMSSDDGYTSAQAQLLITAAMNRFCPGNTDYLQYAYA